MSVGYQRKRAAAVGKWEGPLTSFGLLLGGIIVTVLVVLRVLQIQLP